MLIGVVGPCGAGKSSLVAGLKAEGFLVRHIAQEHSYVPDMWKRLSNPDILIYLDVSYENTILTAKTGLDLCGIRGTASQVASRSPVRRFIFGYQLPDPWRGASHSFIVY